MKTFEPCKQCFYNQIKNTADLINLDSETYKKIYQEVYNLIENIDYSLPPAEIGGKVYEIFHKYSKNYNPYKEIKEEFIEKVLKIYPVLKNKLTKIKDKNTRLKLASKISALGNIIDFGINSQFDASKEIENIFHILDNLHFTIDNFNEFLDQLKKSNTILYIGDNAGETVLDRIFIEEIIEYKTKYLNKKAESENLQIIFATREKPIINDATLEDAIKSGLDKVAKLISSGVVSPGTILKNCNKEFLNYYKKADIVISKGQGNFEGLSDEKRKIFFILKAKCDVIANYLKVEKGSLIFKLNKLK